MTLDLKQAFGEVLRELRESREMSQQELADYSEMDRTYLSDLERGLNNPTLSGSIQAIGSSRNQAR